MKISVSRDASQLITAEVTDEEKGYRMAAITTGQPMSLFEFLRGIRKRYKVDHLRVDPSATDLADAVFAVFEEGAE